MFPVIVAEGSPYDLGYVHGSQAKKQVEFSIKTYREMFDDYSKIGWGKAKQLASGYKNIIKEYDQELFAEMQGVADGAKLEFEDILALNTRSEIVLAGKYLEGCTSLAVTPEKGAGEMLIAQNWDWKLSQKEAIIIIKIKQKNKPDILMVTEAGIIGKIGLNSAGLGVCLNALASDLKPEGVPLHIVLRGILNSGTLSDAIRAVGNPGIACSANFLTASKEGETITIEATSKDYDVIYGSEGFLAHTNHFTSLRLANIKDTGKLIFPDSFVRLGRAIKLIKELGKKIDVEGIKEILSDHVERPNSICRHENFNDDPGMRMGTVFSIIMNLNKMEIYISPGSPCSNKYTRHPF